MKEKIIEELRGSGIGTVGMHGIHCMIDYLSEMICKDESILTAVLSYNNAIPGVFIVTNERVLFLGKKNLEDQFHTISVNFGEITFIDHKKVRATGQISIKNAQSAILIEDIPYARALQIVYMIQNRIIPNGKAKDVKQLKSLMNKNKVSKDNHFKSVLSVLREYTQFADDLIIQKEVEDEIKVNHKNALKYIRSEGALTACYNFKLKCEEFEAFSKYLVMLSRSDNYDDILAIIQFTIMIYAFLKMELFAPLYIEHHDNFETRYGRLKTKVEISIFRECNIFYKEE